MLSLPRNHAIDDQVQSQSNIEFFIWFWLTWKGQRRNQFYLMKCLFELGATNKDKKKKEKVEGEMTKRFSSFETIKKETNLNACSTLSLPVISGAKVNDID